MGENVKNINKEFNTKIIFSNSNDKTSFLIGDLFGRINIKLKNGKEYKYLYLRDDENSKYKQLNSLKDNLFFVDGKGDYALTAKKTNSSKISPIIIIISIFVFVLIGVIYILVKKRHWFW